VASADTFANHSPIDGKSLGRIHRGGRAEIDAAVSAARAAFPSWAAIGPRARAEFLFRLADLIESRVEELSQIETADNGSLLRWHRHALMPRVAHNIRFFADWAVNHLHHPDLMTGGHRNVVSWDPSGVAALITPWNAPLMLATWKIGPALAAGDTVVLKPAEWTPLSASYLADLTAEIGLPAGVFNVVQGYGAEAGAALVSHPDVSRISFTGSVTTAKAIARAAADNLTPCSFELGGKSPLVVMDDADLDLAVRLAVDQYNNAGQVCLSGTRLLVHSTVAEAFAARFTEHASRIRQGDPRDDTTLVGPNIHPTHIDRVSGFVDRARQDGARVIFGGDRNTALGNHYYQPTLIADAKPGSEILTAEVFGPVLTIQTFDSDEEAIELANNTEYGLAAVLVTSDRDRAERVSASLVAGTVWVNCFYVRDLRVPFGGSRKSGIGREGGFWSFDFYADVKNVVTAPWD
jgi:5-carboxymethyl-2-hydroxymuconic-semialdehyde dehydrogenase